MSVCCARSSGVPGSCGIVLACAVVHTYKYHTYNSMLSYVVHERVSIRFEYCTRQLINLKLHYVACASGFRSDAGPWTVLGADALVEDEGTYKPDFSAHAGSERLRCVRISKASFDTITSMSKQEEEAPPALRMEAHSSDADGGGAFGGTSAASAAAGGIGRDSGAKPTSVVSDEGAIRSMSTPTANSSSTGSTGGTAAGRITVSPPKRRGITSHASLKILQAATGAAVVPSAATPKQNRQPDKPREAEEEQGQKSPGGMEPGPAVGDTGDVGISMTTAAASTAPSPSNLEAGTSSGPPPPLPPPEDS